MKQHIVDLTHTLSVSTPVYPGKTSFSKVICAYYEGGYRLDDMTLGTGIGTHMDAPSHFFRNGVTSDAISLSQCFGSACVVDVKDKVQANADYAITHIDIQEWEARYGTIPAQSIVLLHTGWDQYWETPRFCETGADSICHFPGLDADAAELLVARGVKMVGIDAMGIDVGSAPQFVAHKILLGAGIVLIENMANLGMLPPTGSMVHILPMKIKDTPESPVRAMAVVLK